MRKRIWYLLIVVFLLLGFPQKVRAADYEEEILSQISFTEIEQLWEEELGTNDLTFFEVFQGLLHSEHQGTKKDVVKLAAEYMLGEVKECRPLLVQILVITIAFSFLHNFINVFQNSQITQTGFYLYFLIMMVLLMRSFQTMYQLTDHVLEVCCDFMQALIPAFCMTMSFASAATTAMAFYQISLVVMGLVERALQTIFLPGVQTFVVLEMLNHMTDGRLLMKLTALMKSVLRWGLRAMFAGVAGMNVIEHMIAPSVDNLNKMTITKTLGMIPGLGSTAEAVSNLLIGSAVVIKNGLGAAAILALVILCAGPFLKLLILTFLYRAAGAVILPLANKRVCGCMESVGEGAVLLLSVMTSCLLMFLITIAVVVTALR